jgi:hypothetical protein
MLQMEQISPSEKINDFFFFTDDFLSDQPDVVEKNQCKNKFHVKYLFRS